MRLNKATALAVVTGRRTGIGYEVCRGLGTAGAFIVIAGDRDKAARIPSQPTCAPRVMAAEAQASTSADAASVDSALADIEQIGTAVADILVKSAGIGNYAFLEFKLENSGD